ncbi:hypothetical protein [Mucilaginibacter lacusdianchii]|nr:hypothetical protein [Mucilaginibacter sp. JXJ CY 39]
MLNLKNRLALITGVFKGLDRGIAEKLASEDLHLVLKIVSFLASDRAAYS